MTRKTYHSRNYHYRVKVGQLGQKRQEQWVFGRKGEKGDYRGPRGQGKK